MAPTLREGLGTRSAAPRPPLWAVGLTVVGAAAFTATLLIVIPPWAVGGGDLTGSDEIRLSAEASVRATILQALGGLALAMGLAYTAITARLSRETHLTDRFARAVEQLGHDKREVRIGGIYALQRLALNSPIDQSAISDLLRAYLRIHGSHVQSEQPPPPRDRLDDDLQAALTGPHGAVSALLAVDLSDLDLRGAKLRRAQFAGACLDRSLLSGAQLAEVNLDGASLNGAVLEAADLSRASLRRARLHQAVLSRANLTTATLDEADLRLVNLSGARLDGASLRDAYLTSSLMRGAQLQAASLSSAVLDYCDLREADLTGADLEGANLSRSSLSAVLALGVNLRGANLESADLTGATLARADLHGAMLRGAKLVSADLREADLTGADLTGADVTGADLRGADVSGTILTGPGDAGTQSPRDPA